MNRFLGSSPNLGLGSATPKNNSQTPAACPGFQLNSDTLYQGLALESTAEVKGSVPLVPPTQTFQMPTTSPGSNLLQLRMAIASPGCYPYL